MRHNAKKKAAPTAPANDNGKHPGPIPQDRHNALMRAARKADRIRAEMNRIAAPFLAQIREAQKAKQAELDEIEAEGQAILAKLREDFDMGPEDKIHPQTRQIIRR